MRRHLAFLALLVGCGGSTDNGTSAGAGGQGATSTGGRSYIPVPAAGGDTSQGGINTTAGGVRNTGGANPTGGTIPTASTTTTGGATSSITTGGTGASDTSGGAGMGGNNATGGTSAVGGTTSTGGTNSIGGDTATGGVTGTGGTSIRSMGGATPVVTGGTKATGGTTSAIATGGAVSTGGAATGGAATGGTATGGTPATGGAATGGVPSTGGAATGGYSATAGCPGTGGPSMVMLPQGYCIDSTEVTRDQYAAWLAMTPALPASSDANCGWKSTGSYAAATPCMAQGTVCRGTACGNHPQVCVDWCDAYAYCADVGKRLCGKIGGGPNLFADYANASLSQWYNACTSAGANVYPYVGAYNKMACNGIDLGVGVTVAAGSLASCQAPAQYAGVYDLSGNVWEWEDSCNGTGQLATCHIRGGSFGNVSGDLACSFYSAAYYDRSDAVGGETGFRCCSQ